MGWIKKKYKYARRSFYCQGKQNTYLLKWLTHTIQTPVSKNNWILLIVTIVTTYWVKKKRCDVSKACRSDHNTMLRKVTYDLGIAEYSSLVWSIDEKNRHGVVVITVAVVGLWYWVALAVADLILLWESLLNIIVDDDRIPDDMWCIMYPTSSDIYLYYSMVISYIIYNLLYLWLLIPMVEAGEKAA